MMGHIDPFDLYFFLYKQEGWLAKMEDDEVSAKAFYIASSKVYDAKAEIVYKKYEQEFLELARAAQAQGQFACFMRLDNSEGHYFMSALKKRQFEGEFLGPSQADIGKNNYRINWYQGNK